MTCINSKASTSRNNRALRKSFFIIVVLLGLFTAGNGQQMKLTDRKATRETKALYQNLHDIAKKHILFGHQHAMEYGHGWQGEPGRSDVKSVTGSNPAVIGVDFSGLSGRPNKDIQKEKVILRKLISDTYNRGGAVTASWHFNSPASAGGFYWKDSVSVSAVPLLLPGGQYNQQYKNILRNIADVAAGSKGKHGELVPIIFRPYHEFDGDWFWWGASHCTREDFISLWKFTVSYLRDSLQVHNFIYAFSPDNKFTSTEKYLERYPGDDWVDILGVDNYGDWGRDGKYDLDAGIKKLQIVSNYAERVKKVAAFTETGLESIPNKTWWTQTLLKSLQSVKLHLAYVLVWRNDATSPTHFYAPFPGQVSERDFLIFYNDPYTYFEADLKKKSLYKN